MFAPQNEYIYILELPVVTRTMMTDLRRASAFVCYQITVMIGIVALPFALLAQRFGLTLPIGRVVDTAAQTYEETADQDE